MLGWVLGHFLVLPLSLYRTIDRSSVYAKEKASDVPADTEAIRRFIILDVRSFEPVRIANTTVAKPLESEP